MDAEPVANTLGQKRKLYNECVKSSYICEKPVISHYIEGEDVEKLMKIDIACQKKDVPFILNALMDEDLLYVSRTIKQSTWLITDKEYASIINPEYLYKQQLPKMTRDASNKLLKHVKLHLKDTARVEAFYENEGDTRKALKWLPNCSLPFIEEKAKEHATAISPQLLKRLCQKSTTIFDIVMHNNRERIRQNLNVTLFILYQDADKYLNVIKDLKSYELPEFGVKGTKIIMNHCPELLIKNIQKFMDSIDVQTFIRSLKQGDIKDTLYKLSEKYSDEPSYRLGRVLSDNFKDFIQCMPYEERFKFVNAVFIDKVHENKNYDIYNEEELKKMAKLYKAVNSGKDNSGRYYTWYEFAPFEIAFNKIKAHIHEEPNIDIKYTALNILAVCAGSNLLHLRELLQYYCNKHINDKFEHKHRFITDIISRKRIHEYDENTWTALNKIFNTMEIYSESECDVQKCIECIIVYKVINNEHVPKIVEKKFVYNTLKSHGFKMKQEHKDKLFTYLFQYMISKLERPVANETEFKENIATMHNILLTLKDWNKEFVDYPILLHKIREFINMKKENGWKTDLSILYNVNKSWKKHMFEESLNLNPSEEVCINALKHDPELLKRYDNAVNALICNNKVSLNRLLKKLRIFWSVTLAKDWVNNYLQKLNQTNEHKAIIRGLCTILPAGQILEIIKKYTPDESKINWSQVDGNLISLQRNIAKSMHLARPHPPPDAILSYAIGDYLQYAIPSLLAIYHNLSVTKSRECLPKLLNSPISLQKHGIRLAFIKMQPDELKEHFQNIWTTTKNLTIRAIVFKLTYDILCKEKDPIRVKEFWDLLAIFIDNLSFEEDKKIYQLLGAADKVPLNVRPHFIVKSYIFLQKYQLQDASKRENYENIIYNILHSARHIIEDMCPDFISELLIEFIPRVEVEINYQEHAMIRLISAFLLSCRDEETQTQRYKLILVPLMERSFKSWDKETVRKNFISWISHLRTDLEKFITKNMIIPAKLYSDLETEIKKVLTVSENYLLLTEWKLMTAFAMILKNSERSDWNSMCQNVAPEFGKICVMYLKEDIETHFSLIYELFAEALASTLERLVDDKTKTVIYTNMISDKKYVPSYLVLLCRFHLDKEIAALIAENTSVEVKMHFYNKFRNNY